MCAGSTTDNEPPDVDVTEAVDVEVTDAGDVGTATQRVGAVAANIGFDPADCANIEDLARELARALSDHGGGNLAIKRLSRGSETGIRFETRQFSPKTTDMKTTSKTGSSTSGSLGLALSDISQTMDEITVTPSEGAMDDRRLVADRWLSTDHEAPNRIPASIGAASMALASETLNGDTYLFKTWNDETLVGIIDGLGHGPRAHEASAAARNYVVSHAKNSLASIFRGADRACSGTRGVVMALAKFDWTAETVTFANVGNINARVAGPEWTGFLVRRGVIGGNNPGASVVTQDWDPSYTLVLHSDGLSTQWTWKDIRSGNGSADTVANRLLEQYGKSDDDATVLVVTKSND